MQQKSQTKFQMQKIIYSSLLFFSILSNAQVGINTETPETTLEVVGKPDEINHYDGILLPKMQECWRLDRDAERLQEHCVVQRGLSHV